MKKKNKPIEISTNTIFIILAISILVILITGFSFGWDKVIPGTQDKFTIYKEECWNLSDEVTYYQKLQESNFLRSKEWFACNHGCTIMIQVEYKNNYSLEIERYNEHFFNCKKVCSLDYLVKDEAYWRIYEEVNIVELLEGKKEICEFVEVDEIEYMRTEEELMKDYLEDIDQKYLTYIRYKNVCMFEYIYSNNFGECMKKYEYIKIRNISKKDLTTEWLDENCECIKCETKINTEITSTNIGECNGKYSDALEKCSMYLCGDYLVEVK